MTSQNCNELELNRSLLLKPYAQVKSDLVQTQAEIDALLYFKEKFFVGGGYRGFASASQDAVVIMAGLKLNENWTLAYAYDATLSVLKTVTTGSHEILLNYNFGKPIGKGVPPRIIYNPRF